jgi:succinylarginine dihydrolase
MPDLFHEVNFDGVIGPTHNYAGLSRGNLASQQHRAKISNPREAALQGLAKMKFMADLGVKQAVLPPQDRPDLRTLRAFGFGGSDARVLETARRQAPELLAACYSASAMWAANAATVSPSPDTTDGRVHFTPANLLSQFHRSLEPPATAAVLKAIFADPLRFAHHEPVPVGLSFGDEGAANHMRLCAGHGQPGIEIFVYGLDEKDGPRLKPMRFPARQARPASEAVARKNSLDADFVLFIRQNPAAIDTGAFHNDVVAVANENVMLYHAEAFADANESASAIRERYHRRYGEEPVLIEIPSDEMSLEDAVKSYLFNSQLISTPTGMTLVCPTECHEIPAARAVLSRILGGDTPVKHVHYVDVRQSMHNGGGPACLRLRVVLSDAELTSVASGVFLTDGLYTALTDWVRRHYRDQLHPDDLADVQLLQETRRALDELPQILQLSPVDRSRPTDDLKALR